MIRSLQTVSRVVIALAIAAAVPASAQDRAAAAAELRRHLDALGQRILEAETGPFEPGSEGSGKAALSTQRAVIATVEQEIAARRQTARDAQAALATRLSAFAVARTPTPQPVPQASAETPSEPQQVAAALQQIDLSNARLTDPYLGGDRRVLSLPGARMLSLKQGSPARALPVFSIFYSLGSSEIEGRTFVAVGRTADRHEGWIDRDQTEEWNSMLVLQYAPLGNRRPVVFWNDDAPLRDILDSHFIGPQDAEALYDGIAAGTFDRSSIVSIEPNRPVDANERPYFMPIIDHIPARFDDIDGTPVSLLELAMVNLNSSDREKVDTIESGARTDRDIAQTELQNLRTGVVFVVDSTRSMGPYIDGVRDFMRSFRRTSVDMGFEDRTGFGLIGYRDNTANNTQIGYTTATFLPLAEDHTADEFEAAISRIEPSRVSTTDWREDAFAGIVDALAETDWSGYDARYVILVTDAGPRVIGDALARDSTVGPRAIGRLADRQDISLSIVHMQTTEGLDDHRAATSAYGEVARTRGGSVPTYFVVRGDGPAGFRSELSRLGSQFAEPLAAQREGQAIESDTALSIFEGDTFRALEGNDGTPVVIEDGTGEGALADGIVSELFRFQQEYLGQLEGGEAPDFYRAWVADRDLVAPGVASLDVKVLITRDQLSDLTARLRDLISQLDNKQTGARDAYAALVDVSGRATYDPAAAVGAALMPDYIADLPYKTRFLSLKLEEWAGLGPQQQGEILQTVRDRISLFEDIARTEGGWLDLPGRDGGLAVYPLALDDLP